MKITTIHISREFVKEFTLRGPTTYGISNTGYRQMEIKVNPRVLQLAVL